MKEDILPDQHRLLFAGEQLKDAVRLEEVAEGVLPERNRVLQRVAALEREALARRRAAFEQDLELEAFVKEDRFVPEPQEFVEAWPVRGLGWKGKGKGKVGLLYPLAAEVDWALKSVGRKGKAPAFAQGRRGRPAHGRIGVA